LTLLSASYIIKLKTNNSGGSVSMEAYELERPILAVDVVIFAIEETQLQVLLHRRTEEPFQNALALPGVAVRLDETLENAARRALIEKAKWSSSVRDAIYLDQLATFDALYRDPRGRTVSVAYMGLTRVKPGDGEGVMWKRVADIAKGSLPFDHHEIIETAVIRLRGKLRYTNIAKGFLSETFRIEELQEVYEAILGREVNRTNFRNKLLKIKLIEKVSILIEAVGKQGGRPPHLYRFTQNLLEAVDHDFL
jgi:8-oxo-dGTP diphosphatase